ARFAESGDFADLWHPYIASRRALSLSALLLLVPEARGTADWQTVERFLRLNVAYIMRNLEIDLGFNHLERNLAALALFALGSRVVPPAIAAALRANFTPIVLDSICDDGVPKERSGMYLVL